MKKFSKDRLSELFALQTKFNNRVVPEGMKKYLQGRASQAERNKWLLRNARAIIHEAVELEDSCLWKWWSKDKDIDLQNIRVEIVDLWHFLLSITMFAGLDADELYRLYRKKLLINHRRQDKNYSKKTKDESDNLSVV